MIRICKNHTPTIDTKYSDRYIQDKESSTKVLEILKIGGVLLYFY